MHDDRQEAVLLGGGSPLPDDDGVEGIPRLQRTIAPESPGRDEARNGNLKDPDSLRLNTGGLPIEPFIWEIPRNVGHFFMALPPMTGFIKPRGNTAIHRKSKFPENLQHFQGATEPAGPKGLDVLRVTGQKTNCLRQLPPEHLMAIVMYSTNPGILPMDMEADLVKSGVKDLRDDITILDDALVSFDHFNEKSGFRSSLLEGI